MAMCVPPFVAAVLFATHPFTPPVAVPVVAAPAYVVDYFVIKPAAFLISPFIRGPQDRVRCEPYRAYGPLK
jgi:hypothetical protein